MDKHTVGYHAGMPRLTDEALEEFCTLWEQEFGESILRDDAGFRAREIIMLYERLYVSGAGLMGSKDEEAPPQTSS